MKRNEDARRRIRSATSAAMKRRAVATKCGACGRKNAMLVVRDSFGARIGSKCRWCGAMRGFAG